VPRVRAQVDVRGHVVEAERLWYDTARWPAFVDGFGHLVRREPQWPEAGSVLWDAKPGGRGRVLERVARHRAGDGQDAEIEDSKLTGTQSVRFAGVGEELVRVSLELTYELKAARSGFQLVASLFVRRALGDSLDRTLRRFAIELAADRELLP
jgi:hypothetical protein